MGRDEVPKVTRAPFQVLVYPYRRVDDGAFEYALLRRSDAGYWQAVAGGGEDDETPLEAARREAYEEAGIPPGSPFLQLDTGLELSLDQVATVVSTEQAAQALIGRLVTGVDTSDADAPAIIGK